MSFPSYKLVDIVVSRHIDAPPGNVFDAWLDPACPASLWEGAQQLVLDVTEGALFYWVVEYDGHAWQHYGRFHILDRTGGRIEHTWMSAGTRGLESCVRITLMPSATGGTDFRLVHAGLPDDELGNLARYGWTRIADEIAAHVEALVAS